MAGSPLPAQSIVDGSVRTAPQILVYELGSPVARRVTQVAIPMAIVIPIGRGLVVDLGTAWASAEVEGEGTRSRVEGLTDTQLRATYTLGRDAVVLTAGLNLPTGQSTVDSAGIEAAGIIGNDFLAFPISNMGTGFGGTGGLAAARTFGAWSLGAGASMRYSARYEPFEIGGDRVQYEPGNEYRLRIGGDRMLFGGRFAFGLTAAFFGDDAAGGTTYATGDRYIVQAGLARRVGGTDLTISGWNLTRGTGETIAGTAPWENIANLTFVAGMEAGGARIEPSVELRHRYESGSGEPSRDGVLATLGLRAGWRILGVSVSPAVGYTIGGVDATAGERSRLTGWRASVGMRSGR
ncbi:MAG TPA: hypothetical protein VMM18_13950 [Gemmatimonadaceae bacterium]|nr:hypothetical protein [Gemmatimonadaceae bacterium]